MTTSVVAPHDQYDRCTLVALVHGTCMPEWSMKAADKLWNAREEVSSRDLLLRLYRKPVSLCSKERFEENYLAPLTRVDKEVNDAYQSVFATSSRFGNRALSFFYFYWDGWLNAASRKVAAYDLYRELLREREKLLKTYKKVDIAILTHSHGGNVALSLADVYHHGAGTVERLPIDTLVLLGMPVQEETKDFIYSDLFKDIYTVYSVGDKVQTMDVLSTKGFSSQRIFKSDKTKKALPLGLKQVEVSVWGAKPSHDELWMFGHPENIFHRKIFFHEDFPIFPYPVSLFAPFILDYADREKKDVVTFDLKMTRSDVERMIQKKK